VAAVETVFYKYDTYIEDKTDSKSGAVIVQLLWSVGCGPDRVIEVRFLAGSRDFPPLQGSQAKSLVHAASCSVGRAFSRRVKQV
jgi:hypothetical protein